MCCIEGQKRGRQNAQKTQKDFWCVPVNGVAVRFKHNGKMEMPIGRWIMPRKTGNLMKRDSSVRAIPE